MGFYGLKSFVPSSFFFLLPFYLILERGSARLGRVNKHSVFDIFQEFWRENFIIKIAIALVRIGNTLALDLAFKDLCHKGKRTFGLLRDLIIRSTWWVPGLPDEVVRVNFGLPFIYGIVLYYCHNIKKTEMIPKKFRNHFWNLNLSIFSVSNLKTNFTDLSWIFFWNGVIVIQL